ncbi:hypothetical protein F9C07_9674 [Aspergillus flavus]|uniref:Uncharacterized protein n=1 Tax=Aspergillus flavus (strain ATCC 200026 / FGSC A1120 / IAM 13836 / NRRL 3357 / JCM 12722 / SRRC 167) TaxID=332952 RepID=A0A7U2QRD7_ASPFN|nr:hypothetical protein F9C07_9674 [Aspergillus flavus]
MRYPCDTPLLEPTTFGSTATGCTNKVTPLGQWRKWAVPAEIISQGRCILSHSWVIY